MLNIWPDYQPMSFVADLACCAILDFRSPCGNDDNQGMPTGLPQNELTADAIAFAALSAKDAQAFFAGQGSPDRLGQGKDSSCGSRPRAYKYSTTGEAIDANWPTNGLGRTHRATGNR